MEFFINGNIPALKNGKIWSGKFLVKSKRVTTFLKLHNIKTYHTREKTVEYYKNPIPNITNITYIGFLIKNELLKKEKPYKLGFHFVRESHHQFDFGNAVELISDLFTALDVWEDDNMDIFLPFPLERNGSWYSYSKSDPGVYIKIL